MHLVDEGSDTVELILVADAVDERHEKALAIEVAGEIEDVGLKGQRSAIERGTRTDIHHATLHLHRLLHTDPHAIDADGGNELTGLRRIDVGSGEAELTAFTVAGDDLAENGVGIAETVVGQLQFSALDELAYI